MRITGPRLLILPDPPVTTQGGLHITRRVPQMQGRVVAVGSRCKSPVKVGDRVLYDRYQSPNLTVEGVAYVLCAETELIAIIGPGVDVRE